MAHYILWCEILSIEVLLFSLAPMGFRPGLNIAIHYKGFLLLEQPNKSWLVRPQRSPMVLLPFRTPICSLAEVKVILDQKLLERSSLPEAA